MAKDSDKRRVLQRRKQELEHAIKHSYSIERVQTRAEKLRSAAIAVLKKYGGPFVLVEGTRDNSIWIAMQMRWESLLISEIIGLSSRWGTHPTVRDVQIGDGESGQEGKRA